MLTRNSYYAVIAGLCASSASFFGKLPSIVNDDNIFINETCTEQNQLKWLIRIASIVLMVGSNGLVWRFYVKSLQDTKGTLVATLISASANYCCSALLGTLIYGEKTSIYWWVGTLLVLSGLVLILTDTKRDEKNDENNKKLD